MSKLDQTYSLEVANNYVKLTMGHHVGGCGKRGKITGMTYKSRAALFDFLNAAEFSTASFITLTYRYNMQDDKRAYVDLRNWHRAISRQDGLWCAVWRKEYQERGAIHFHVFGLDVVGRYDRELMADQWMIATGQDGDTAARKFGVDRKDFAVLTDKDAGVIVQYMLKYQAKDGATSSGKVWGILGRKAVNDTRRKCQVDRAVVYNLADELTQMGARKVDISGGGVQYRFYAGNIGGQASTERSDPIGDLLVDFGIRSQ